MRGQGRRGKQGKGAVVRARVQAHTWLAACAKASGSSFSRRAAMSGGQDHTMLARPSRTGSSASGPVGRKRCQAVSVPPPARARTPSGSAA